MNDIITQIVPRDTIVPPLAEEHNGATWPYWLVAAACISGAIAVMLLKFPDPNPVLPLWLNKPWCIAIAICCLFGTAAAVLVIVRERQRRKESRI